MLKKRLAIRQVLGIVGCGQIEHIRTCERQALTPSHTLKSLNDLRRQLNIPAARFEQVVQYFIALVSGGDCRTRLGLKELPAPAIFSIRATALVARHFLTVVKHVEVQVKL
jgi:hypothetical protein